MSLLVLVPWELRRASPLIDIRFFKSVPFSAANLIAVCVFASVGGFMLLEQRLRAITDAAGRPLPRIWVTFRPIIAKTDELAWEKAHAYIGKIEDTFQSGTYRAGQTRRQAPETSARSVRLRSRASQTSTTGHSGPRPPRSPTPVAPRPHSSGRLRRSPPQIVDYVDRGASLVSIRGYDTLQDAEDYGKYILPLVRQELAHRKATGRRGTLQVEHPGNYGPEYAAYATR